VLVHVGLEVLFVIALVTLPVYVTGAAAYAHLRSGADFSDNRARMHQDAALTGFAVTEFAGFVAWGCVVQSRRTGPRGTRARRCGNGARFIALAIMGARQRSEGRFTIPRSERLRLQPPGRALTDRSSTCSDQFVWRRRISATW
jgi:hypothetical protein